MPEFALTVEGPSDTGMVLARTGPTLLVAAALAGPVISSRVEFDRIASPPSASLPMGERLPASPGVVGLLSDEAVDLVSGNRYLRTFPGRVDVSLCIIQYTK